MINIIVIGNSLNIIAKMNKTKKEKVKKKWHQIIAASIEVIKV